MKIKVERLFGKDEITLTPETDKDKEEFNKLRPSYEEVIMGQTIKDEIIIICKKFI